jgi:hypothetical protein
MARADDHLRELLKLPLEERAHAAKILLESLGERPVFAEGTKPVDPRDLEDLVDPRSSGPASSDDELTELDDLASDGEELRAAVRSAVEAELEPLHELTRLLQRFAELASTTSRALRARAA